MVRRNEREMSKGPSEALSRNGTSGSVVGMCEWLIFRAAAACLVARQALGRGPVLLNKHVSWPAPGSAAGDPRLAPMFAGAWIGKPTQASAALRAGRPALPPWAAALAGCPGPPPLRRAALGHRSSLPHAFFFLPSPTPQGNPRKIRFFQLSSDGSTLRWGWNKCAAWGGLGLPAACCLPCAACCMPPHLTHFLFLLTCLSLLLVPLPSPGLCGSTTSTTSPAATPS